MCSLIGQVAALREPVLQDHDITHIFFIWGIEIISFLHTLYRLMQLNTQVSLREFKYCKPSPVAWVWIPWSQTLSCVFLYLYKHGHYLLFKFESLFFHRVPLALCVSGMTEILKNQYPLLMFCYINVFEEIEISCWWITCPSQPSSF